MEVAGFVLPGSEGWSWRGVFGSVAVELSGVISAASKRDGVLPVRYYRPAFLVLCGLFALCAGVVPVALDARNMWSAIWLGASAPVFFDRAARGLERAENRDPPGNDEHDRSGPVPLELKGVGAGGRHGALSAGARYAPGAAGIGPRRQDGAAAG